MLSITGMVCDKNSAASMMSRIGIDTWPFASEDWSTIHRLFVPALTLRERLHLERAVVRESNAVIMNELGFKITGKSSLDDVLSSYRNYYRFYPTLLTADV
jgi:hypothetical protein